MAWLKQNTNVTILVMNFKKQGELYSLKLEEVARQKDM